MTKTTQKTESAFQHKKKLRKSLKEVAKTGGFLGGIHQKRNTAWRSAYCTNGMLDYSKLPAEKPNGFRYPLQLMAWKMKCAMDGKETDKWGNIIHKSNRMTTSIKDAVKKPLMKRAMKELVDAK